MPRIFLPLAILLFAGCNSLTGSVSEQISEEPIHIGYIGPLTGDAAAYGSDTRNGMRLAVDNANAAGGINGQRIEIVEEDTQCSGPLAAAAAKRLIEEQHVVAIVGGICSSETLAAAPIVEKAGIPMISPTSSSRAITRAGSFIFRTYPSDGLKTKVLAQYLRQQNYHAVAMISENTEFNRAFRDALQQDLTEEMIVFDESVQPNTKDYRSLFEDLKKQEFDVFFANGQTPVTIGAMILQLRESGGTQPIITHDAGHSNELLALVGEPAEGMQAIDIQSTKDDASLFADAFRKRYGPARHSCALAAHTYDATQILLQAIRNAGTDGTTMRDYLLGLRGFSGAAGTFSFDENGDVQGMPFAIWEVRDGVWVERGQVEAE